MATTITTECINCGACEPECPNTAIYAGGVEWDLNGVTAPALAQDIFYIVPSKCTECVGFYDHEACAAVCPVDCCVPDPNNPESEQVLLERARVLHPEQSLRRRRALALSKGRRRARGRGRVRRWNGQWRGCRAQRRCRTGAQAGGRSSCARPKGGPCSSGGSGCGRGFGIRSGGLGSPDCLPSVQRQLHHRVSSFPRRDGLLLSVVLRLLRSQQDHL